MVNLSRQGSDTVLPGGASEDLGIVWSSILLRRGALEKRSRSRVTDSSSVETNRNTVRVVSCGRFFHGRCGMIPAIVNVRNNGRSPAKRVLFRT